MPSQTPLSDAVKQSIADAFAAVPDGKRGALLVLADEHGAKAMVAAKLGGSWKVAAGTAVDWTGHVSGQVSILGSW